MILSTKLQRIAKFGFNFDLCVNWILGIVFTFLYEYIDSWLAIDPPLLPTIFWIPTGIVFLLFAIWQTKVVLRKCYNINAWLFASIMALVPTIILTVALIIMNDLLQTMPKIHIWIGNIYMGALGIIYGLRYLQLKKGNR